MMGYPFRFEKTDREDVSLAVPLFEKTSSPFSSHNDRLRHVTTLTQLFCVNGKY